MIMPERPTQMTAESFGEVYNYKIEINADLTKLDKTNWQRMIKEEMRTIKKAKYALEQYRKKLQAVLKEANN